MMLRGRVPLLERSRNERFPGSPLNRTSNELGLKKLFVNSSCRRCYTIPENRGHDPVGHISAVEGDRGILVFMTGCRERGINGWHL